jgi:TolB-like protein
MLVLGYFVAGSCGFQAHSGVGHANAPASAVVSNTSIAVLPFVDMSEKKDQEYFADGMTEEIIDRLSKQSGAVRPSAHVVVYFGGQADQDFRHRKGTRCCACIGG